jgi:hypothetical protein
MSPNSTRSSSRSGAGEYESVVAAVLKAVMREGATVEPELVPRLAACIDGYDGDGEHARLRGLLAHGSASREAPGSCEGEFRDVR